MSRALLCLRGMELSVVTNVEAWTANLEDIYRRQIPFATARALNETVEDLRNYHRTILPTVFDRPTRYTLNSLRMLKAASNRLHAGIFFKEQYRDGSHYLTPHVEGGKRRHKRFEYWLIQRGIMQSGEYAVPASGLKLDSFGNVPAGIVQMILSQLAAGPDPFQWETARSRKRAGETRVRYFVPEPGSRLRRGIWRRKSKTRVEPVFIFVSDVTYQKRYQFYELSRWRAEMNFPVYFESAMRAGIDDQRSYRAGRGMTAPASSWSMGNDIPF